MIQIEGAQVGDHINALGNPNLRSPIKRIEIECELAKITGLVMQSYSLPRLSVCWLLGLLTFPLLIVQGSLTRKRIIRLPDAPPPHHGKSGTVDDSGQTAGGGARRGVGEQKVFTVIGIGDSVISGVGIERSAETLTARLADYILARTGRPCHWRAHGVNGDRIADLLAKIDSIQTHDADFVLVSIGVNDVTGLTSLIRWQLSLTSLVAKLQPCANRRIIFLGIPPMHLFTALPQPLRWMLGIRARMLDLSLKQLSTLVPFVSWFDASLAFDPMQLAQDGYHPGALACDILARGIAREIYET